MGLLIPFLIWYFFIRRNQPDAYFRTKSLVKPLAIVIIIVSILSSTNLLAFIVLGLMGTPFLIIVACVLIIRSKKDKIYQRNTAADRVQFDVKDKVLTKNITKRIKIVTEFSEKYDLKLTPTEVNTIVNASYYSVMWESEIIAMNQSYNAIFEWYRGYTSWLRVYLHAFQVQDVSADFGIQKLNVENAFNKIFAETNFKKYVSMKDLLWDINNKYLLNFDDVTFMIAYRFLQDTGHDYDITVSNVVVNEDEADRLKRKYDSQ